MVGETTTDGPVLFPGNQVYVCAPEADKVAVDPIQTFNVEEETEIIGFGFIKMVCVVDAINVPADTVNEIV